MNRILPKGMFSLARILVISSCLAMCVCFVSANLHERFELRPETIHNQFAILRGQPYLVDGGEAQLPQFRSRILFPLLLAIVSPWGILSVSQWYLIVRLATAVLAFGAFLLASTRFENIGLKTATFGAGCLAYGLIFTFNHRWEHPTDFLDVAFFSIAMWLTVRKRRWALLLAVMLGSLNHQTAAVACIIWFCVWGIGKARKVDWREAGYSAGIAFGSYALSTLVKAWVGGTRSAGYMVNGWLTVPDFLDFLRHPQPFSWPFLLAAMVLPVTIWLWTNRGVITGQIRRLLLASIAIVTLSSPIAYWSELRSVFLAPLVIATFVATVSEGRVERKTRARFEAS
jgi:hypothetical protein